MVAGHQTESGSLLINTMDTSAAGSIKIGVTSSTGQNITMSESGFYYTPNTFFPPAIIATTTAPTWASNNIYGSYCGIGKTMF